MTTGVTAFAFGDKLKSICEIPPHVKPDFLSKEQRTILEEIKERLADLSETFVFQPYTQESIDNFKKSVNVMLDEFQSRNQILESVVILDDLCNQDITKNVFYGQLWVKYVDRTEFIVVDFSVFPSKLHKDFDLTGWDYVSEPMTGYEIKG